MVGGELTFALDGVPVPFSLSQDKGVIIKQRRKKKVMALIKDHNP
jgi:hypothetical protein